MTSSRAPSAVLVAVALLLAVSCAASTGTPSENVVHLERFSVFDPAANSLAFTVLKPPGWNASGEIQWHQQYANVASATLSVSDPVSGATAQVFPVIPFIWQEGGIGSLPIGANYLGGEVRPPIGNVPDFVSQLVIPTFRSNVNARVIDFQDTPDVSATVAQAAQEPGLTKDVISGRVRVEYDQNGTLIDEDFYVTLVFSRSPLTPVLQWGPERIYSFRAPAGTLDDHAALMHSIIFSSRVDRQWLNTYLQVVDLFHQGQLQAIQDAAALSRLLAQTDDAIRESTNQAFETRSDTNERISLKFSELIRGVDTYADPFLGSDVQLPAGFDSVWSSTMGDYILSNDANYDPNIGSAIDWEPLRRVTPQP